MVYGSARWLLHGWCHVKCCRFGASSVYTIQPCTRLQSRFIQSHIGRVYACLAVTCHLHFWQNGRDLLRATTVTRGWNGYRNKSQHRKLTLEKKILPPLLQGLEPATFQSRVRRSNHWVIPLPDGDDDDDDDVHPSLRLFFSGFGLGWLSGWRDVNVKQVTN